MKVSKFSKFIVTLVVLANVAFTGAVLYIFLRVQTEPTTLIVSWLAFTDRRIGRIGGYQSEKDYKYG